MTNGPYPQQDREHPKAEDFPRDVQVLDLMWATGQALYDTLIWLRDHPTDGDAGPQRAQEADEVARAMEAAAIRDRVTMWQAYSRFTLRRNELLHLIETELNPRP